MKVRAISSLFVVGMLAVASCTAGAEDESLSGGAADLTDEGELGSIAESVSKGKPRAVNGMTDYCSDPASLCGVGEGDCDSSEQCAAGLACAPNNGPKFGFGSAIDVCAGAHCSNGVMDGDELEADCGGSCGACTACVGTVGGRSFCVGCQCASGQGDCDSNLECASGLTCGANNGAKFGLPASFDVCVPGHCTNRVRDAASGETGVDIGGPCQRPCGNGVLDTGEACDDGINDGVFCSADCSTQPELAQIRVNCDANSSVGAALSGTGCLSAGGGASYITFASSAVEVTLFRNGNCTGNTRTVSSNLNFCGSSFDQGGSLNDQVRSVMIRRR